MRAIVVACCLVAFSGLSATLASAPRERRFVGALLRPFIPGGGGGRGHRHHGEGSQSSAQANSYSRKIGGCVLFNLICLGANASGANAHSNSYGHGHGGSGAGANAGVGPGGAGAGAGAGANSWNQFNQF